MAAFLSRGRTAGKINAHRGENLIGGLSRITANRRSVRMALRHVAPGLDVLVAPDPLRMGRSRVAPLNSARLEAISQVRSDEIGGVIGTNYEPVDRVVRTQPRS